MEIYDYNPEINEAIHYLSYILLNTPKKVFLIGNTPRLFYFIQILATVFQDCFKTEFIVCTDKDNVYKDEIRVIEENKEWFVLKNRWSSDMLSSEENSISLGKIIEKNSIDEFANKEFLAKIDITDDSLVLISNVSSEWVLRVFERIGEIFTNKKKPIVILNTSPVKYKTIFNEITEYYSKQNTVQAIFPNHKNIAQYWLNQNDIYQSRGYLPSKQMTSHLAFIEKGPFENNNETISYPLSINNWCIYWLYTFSYRKDPNKFFTSLLCTTNDCIAKLSYISNGNYFSGSFENSLYELLGVKPFNLERNKNIVFLEYLPEKIIGTKSGCLKYIYRYQNSSESEKKLKSLITDVRLRIRVLNKKQINHFPWEYNNYERRDYDGDKIVFFYGDDYNIL